MADDPESNPEAEVEVHFEPVVKLKPVVIDTLEDEEEEVFKIFEDLTDSPEWKERGLGDIRMLKHKQNLKVRLVMRREKTLKICCNHYLTKIMKLTPHCNSDRAFVWSTLADFTDEEPKPELLAIRFRDAENAQKFKSKFEELQNDLPKLDSSIISDNGVTDTEVVNKLEELSVKETGTSNGKEDEKETKGNDKETKEDQKEAEENDKKAGSSANDS